MARRLGSLNKVLRLIVIGVLLFRLTPIGNEAAEALIAMLAGGDSSPDDGADCEGCTDCEAGCTLVHHCGCCTVTGVLRESTVAMTLPDVADRSVFVLSQPLMEPDAKDLLRPPAA